MRTEGRLEREIKGLRSQKISHIELEQGYTRRDSSGKVEYTADPKAPQKFNYRVKNSQVLLIWEDQKNLTAPHYFEVQRSNNGNEFYFIGNTKNDSYLDIPDLKKDARGSNIPTTYWYKVRIRRTKDDAAGPWSYVQKITVSGINATDISTEVADMLQAGQDASSIAQTLYNYAAGYGVDITEAFGHLNGESFDSATVKVEGTDPATGETTTQYKDFSFIFKNFIIGDVILGNLIKGEHIEANTITANNISAGAITAEKLAADAITGESLDINTILSSDNILIDGGSAAESSTETYNGGAAEATVSRSYNDNRGVYTGVPRNYISIESPLFLKGGAYITGKLESLNGESYFDLDTGFVSAGSGVFRGDLLIGSDNANRQLSVGSEGLLVEDSDDNIIHDLPDAPLTSDLYYLGHFYFLGVSSFIYHSAVRNDSGIGCLSGTFNYTETWYIHNLDVLKRNNSNVNGVGLYFLFNIDEMAASYRVEAVVKIIKDSVVRFENSTFLQSAPIPRQTYSRAEGTMNNVPALLDSDGKLTITVEYKISGSCMSVTPDINGMDFYIYQTGIYI